MVWFISWVLLVGSSFLMIDDGYLASFAFSSRELATKMVDMDGTKG